MDNLNFFQKIQASIAGIAPGWKTITLAGGLAGINILDWIQMNYQTFSPALELIPEPYKTIINVAVPALIMFLRNISQRTDAAKIQAVKLPSPKQSDFTDFPFPFPNLNPPKTP